MAKRQILLLSSSQVHGHEYLHHSKTIIQSFFDKNNVKTVLFIPYALSDYDSYADVVSKSLTKFGYKTAGIHTFANPIDAISAAQAIFIGGGNTFLLLKTLYEKNLLKPIQRRIINDGIAYMGSSAGTNVATRSINTTNDMPIVYPPSFSALNLIPFNINPHYIEPEPNTTHRGETRQQRLAEFHQHNHTPVLGLREGSNLLVDGDKATLVGEFNAKLFKKGENAEEISPNTDLSFLLQWSE